MASIKRKYDYVVLGGGLSGLLTATSLRNNGKNVLLLEASEELGGNIRTTQSPFALNRGLKNFNNDENTIITLKFLSEALGTNIDTTPTEVPPVTFEKGQFHPFVGFGETAPKFVEEIESYTQTKRLTIQTEPHQWLEQLEREYTGDKVLNARVTRIHVEGGRVTEITYNGSKTIEVQNVIYTAPVEWIDKLIERKALSGRLIQKLSKAPFWTSLSLDLVHDKPVCENEAIHVLKGGKDESHACLGQFYKPFEFEGRTVQASQWLTFVDRESSENDEIAGTALREIKKQIKRAYPDALEAPVFERIIFSPESHGNVEVKLTPEQALPGIENLYMACGKINSLKNIPGVLLQTKMVLETLELDWTKRPELGHTSEFETPEDQPQL